MIDHLSAAIRLADARAQQQIREGRGRPARMELVSAIHDADVGPLPDPGVPAPVKTRRASWRLRWQRRFTAASSA